MGLTQGPPAAAWSHLLLALDSGALVSVSNGQGLTLVTLESYTHLGEQGGLPGALHLPRHTVGGGRTFVWSCGLGVVRIHFLP